MKRIPTFLLKAAVVTIGAVVLALCIFALPALWRGATKEYTDMAYALHAILLALYVGSVPFFFGLYQAMRLLNLIDENKAFSMQSIHALKRITYCAITISGVFAASMPFFYLWAQNDDAPGLIIVGMVFVGASLTVAVFAIVLERLFEQAIVMKSENELTV